MPSRTGPPASAALRTKDGGLGLRPIPERNWHELGADSETVARGLGGQETLKITLYPQTAGLPDFPHIKDTLDRAMANDASFVPALSALVAHSNEQVAMTAATALGRFPSPAAGALLKQTLANDGRGVVRGSALAGLARMRDPEARALARAALSDPAGMVRSAGLVCLGDLIGDSGDSLLLLDYFDRYPDEAELLEMAGRLGDPPGSTAVRDRLLQEMRNRTSKTETRELAADGLTAMGRADLARPIVDWRHAEQTYQSLMTPEGALKRFAASRNVAVKSQADVDALLRDMYAAKPGLEKAEGTDEWGRPVRVKFKAEGRFRAISDGPDQRPDTPDDISLDEEWYEYSMRLFPEF